jgi:hypothetical protein
MKPMIEPSDLRSWLLEAMGGEEIYATDRQTSEFCRGRVDAYVRVGERFGVLQSNDPDVVPLLPSD